MDCAYCGAPIGEGSDACSECGLPVAASIDDVATSFAAEYMTPDPDVTPAGPKSTGPEGSGAGGAVAGGAGAGGGPAGPTGDQTPFWKRPWFWVVIAAVVVVIAIIIAIAVAGGGSSSTTETSTTNTTTVETPTTAPPTTASPTTAPPTTAPPTTAPPTTAPPTTAPPTTTTTVAKQVSIVNLAFDPATLKVKAGDTVTWVNDDTTAHDVVADDGSFDSGSLAPGASYQFVFPTAGTVAYHCSIHPQMTGTVVVQ